MNTPALVQAMLISGVVGWSLVFSARRLLPAASRRVQAKLASAFDRPTLPAWLRAASRKLQPPMRAARDCSDGCSTCGGCPTGSAKPAVEAQVLEFRAREPR